MRLWSNASFAALLLGSSVALPALAAAPYTGCPAGYHRAEAEGGGVGSVSNQTRKAEAEGGGVGSVSNQTRKAEAEGGGVGSVNNQTRRAEAEGGGVGSVNMQTRRAEALADMPCVQNSR
ncbi:MAG TPA: hypothetical protein VH855_28675 [Acetobacteraceae bacterium]|jgi:hypothetical protein